MCRGKEDADDTCKYDSPNKMQFVVPTSVSEKRKMVLLQVVLGIIANLSNLSPGMSLGYSAVTLPQMKDSNATFHVDDSEASWIASLASISTPVGCLLAGPLLDRYGRRLAILSLNIPCVIGWMLIAFSNGDSTLLQVYAGRILTGLATGMASSPAAVYVAEITRDNLRGMLVTWTSVSISLGILIVYVLGSVLQGQWQLVAGISSVFPFIAFILTYFFLPESPTWLMSKDRLVEAERNYKKVRGCPENEKMSTKLQDEFYKMIQKHQLVMKIKEEHPDRNFLKAFVKPSGLKPFLIMNAFFFFQQFSGTFVIIFYAVDVVKEAGIGMDPYIVAILIAITRLFITIFISYISKRYGRRLPAIVSGSGMTICMIALTVYLYLDYIGGITEQDLVKLSWLPVTCLLLHIFTSTVGFLTLPWAMIGEVYPGSIRGLACGLTTCFGYVFSFIAVKTYPDMLTSLNKHGVFLFYGLISLFGTVFVYIFLPETNGKTLVQIEDEFNEKRNKFNSIFLVENKNSLFFHPDEIPIPRKNKVKPNEECLSINYL